MIKSHIAWKNILIVFPLFRVALAAEILIAFCSIFHEAVGENLRCHASSFPLTLHPMASLSKPTLNRFALPLHPSPSPAQATELTILMWHLPDSRGSRDSLLPAMS